MIIKTSKDKFEEITYNADEKNYGIMNPINDIDSFNVKTSNNNDSDKVFDFVEKLIKFVKAEGADWGRKEVYLSFDEIRHLITNIKSLYDIYEECQI